MSVQPMLAQRQDYGEVEEKLRDLQRAASLFAYVGMIAVEASHSKCAGPELDDLRGLAWLAETIKAMTDDLHDTLFPK